MRAGLLCQSATCAQGACGLPHLSSMSVRMPGVACTPHVTCIARTRAVVLALSTRLEFCLAAKPF